MQMFKSFANSILKSNKKRSRNYRVQTFQIEPLEPRVLLAGLLGQADLEFLGSFRVPHSDSGSSTFAYGGTAPAFNAANNSLFLVGHDQDQAIAEITIPDLVISDQLNDLNTASFIQPFVDVEQNIPNWTLSGESKIGGLEVIDGQLTGTFYEYYDANNDAIDSHFRFTSTNLNSSSLGGLYQVGDLGGGYVGGYMAQIPLEWQDALGAPYLTGQAALSIISRTSAGPAAFGFDPDDLGNQTAQTTTYVNYPLSNPLAPVDSTNPLFNLTTEITGVVFPENSDSIIFFGMHGTGEYCYGSGEECNDPVDPYQGTHSMGGLYEHQAWAYDVHDFIDVKNGVKESWEIQPYDVWNFDLPIEAAQNEIGGITYDSATGRIYVAQLDADRPSFSPYPLISVFQLPTDSNPDQGPVITGVSTFDVAENTASIQWITDVPADSRVEYGLSPSFGNTTTLDPALVTNHEVSLTGLQSESLYYYRVVSQDAGGDETISSTHTFSTLPPDSNQGPQISGITASELAENSASIQWTTDIPADSRVEFGLSNALGSSSSLDPALVINHDVGLAGLQANSLYYYRVVSTDGNGNESVSVTNTFNTLPIFDETIYSYDNPMPLPPADPASTTTVNDINQLLSAINNLQSGQTIAIAPGIYDMTGVTDAFYIPQGISDWAIRGESGNRDDVTILGDGMNGSVRFGFWIGNSPNGTIADLTIDGMSEHGIIANFGAHDVLFHGLRVVDVGDQFIKSNPSGSQGNARGIVQYSILEYRTTAPDDYTNGVDVHAGEAWNVQYNLFKNFVSPQGQALAGPAVLMWNGSFDSVVQGNTFINNARGVSLGLIDRSDGFDHIGGVIKNNSFYRDSGLNGAIDVPIYVSDSPDTQIYHNTVLDLGNYPNSIEYRFASSTNIDIRNNLISHAITARQGATATIAGNLNTATESMFVNPAVGNLHLNSSATTVIDVGSPVNGVVRDLDAQQRDSQVDIGADEYGASNLPPSINNFTFALNENSLSGELVGIVTATDPEELPLSFAITAGNTSDAFVIDSITGEIHVSDSSGLDFEVQPDFDLTVEVTDDQGLTDSATVTINLNDVNEAPVVSDQSFTAPQVPDVGQYVGVVVADDVDQGSQLTYSISAGNDGNVFAVDSSTGEITVINPWNAGEQPPIFTIDVVDQGGLNNTGTITVMLDPEPLSHYSFSEGVGRITTDHAGRDARLSGPDWVNGFNGLGLDFDGTYDRVAVKRDSDFNFTNSFTFSMFVNPASLDDWQTGIYRQRQTGGLSYALYTSDANSLPAVHINLGQQDITATAADSLELNAWSHLAATFDGSILKLYVNGELVEQTAASGVLATPKWRLQFGSDNFREDLFNGTMDEVKLFDTALSDSQVAALVNIDPQPLQSTNQRTQFFGSLPDFSFDNIELSSRSYSYAPQANGLSIRTANFVIEPSASFVKELEFGSTETRKGSSLTESKRDLLFERFSSLTADDVLGEPIDEFVSEEVELFSMN